MWLSLASGINLKWIDVGLPVVMSLENDSEGHILFWKTPRGTEYM
jgi:hypothetical protein